MEQQTGFKELFLRLVAIVGLIAVLVLGAWGIILLAFNLVGLFNGSVHLSNLFSNDNTATTTAPVVVTQNNGNTGSNAAAPSNTTSTSASKPSGSTTQAGNATAVYTAAPRAQSLYGFADLKVTITSVNSLSSAYGRTTVTFTISNAGTNVAYSGWTFNAQLPLNPVYTYQSAPQQALYPGDKIAYTLTYDDPNYSQYCTQQYPSNCYNNGYYNNNQYNYQYPYNYNQTCYTYNGYQNVAGPCPTTYDQSGNPIYNSGYNYDYGYNNNYYNQYPYNYNYNYYNQYAYRTVSVTVDPTNTVPESVEYNNTASKSF